jgi:O-antigen/teichoic acid export membrane protein
MTRRGDEAVGEGQLRGPGFEGLTDADAAASEDVLDTGAAAGMVIRGGAGRTIGYVAGLLIGLLAVPLMIRELGVERYGYYITAASVVLLVYAVSEGGLTALGVREYATARESDRQFLLRNLLGLRLMLTSAGVIIASSVLALTGAHAAIVRGTLILGLGLLLGAAQQTYQVVLLGQLRLGSVTLLELSRQSILTAAILVVVASHLSLNAFFWANVIASSVMTAATVALLRHEAPLRPSFDPTTWKALLRETLPFALSYVIALVYFRIAVVLMSYITTAEATGYYAAAFRIVEVVAIAPWLLISSAFPILARAARHDRDRFSYAVQRIFEVSVILGPWMALSIGVLAPFAVAVVAGDGFEQSIGVLRILGVAHVTGFLAVSGFYAMLSLKRYRELLIANIFAVTVAIIGTGVLAPRFGAHGAAAATVAADGTLAIACFVVLARMPGLQLKLTIVPKAALSLIAGLIPALVLSVHPLLLVVLSSLAYFAVAQALRAIPIEVVHAFRQWRGDAGSLT